MPGGVDPDSSRRIARSQLRWRAWLSCRSRWCVGRGLGSALRIGIVLPPATTTRGVDRGAARRAGSRRYREPPRRQTEPRGCPARPGGHVCTVPATAAARRRRRPRAPSPPLLCTVISTARPRPCPRAGRPRIIVSGPAARLRGAVLVACELGSRRCVGRRAGSCHRRLRRGRWYRPHRMPRVPATRRKSKNDAKPTTSARPRRVVGCPGMVARSAPRGRAERLRPTCGAHVSFPRHCESRDSLRVRRHLGLNLLGGAPAPRLRPVVLR